jgi:acetoin utilization deacetylase AcuC-like enzyme
MTTGIIYSDIYLLHETGTHPECPARLAVVRDRLRKTGLWETARVYEPRPATPEELLLVHTQEHIDTIEHACTLGRRYLDPDTVVCRASFEVARAAVGGVLSACDAVMRGEVTNAFCMVRPPGHHASRTRAMGFCLFNHVAVAARYLQREHGVEHVLIVDFDVHHGNGTQAILYDDDSVFYYSMHRWPFYPGTGASGQTGEGRGLGFTRNLTVTAGTDRQTIVSFFVKTLDEVARGFTPDFVLVSAGFDASENDPIAGLGLGSGDFGEMTRAIVELAHDACKGRLVSTLEGGYDLDALGHCVEAHLRALMNA